MVIGVGVNKLNNQQLNKQELHNNYTISIVHFCVKQEATLQQLHCKKRIAYYKHKQEDLRKKNTGLFGNFSPHEGGGGGLPNSQNPTQKSAPKSP